MLQKDISKEFIIVNLHASLFKNILVSQNNVNSILTDAFIWVAVLVVYMKGLVQHFSG